MDNPQLGCYLLWTLVHPAHPLLPIHSNTAVPCHPSLSHVALDLLAVLAPLVSSKETCTEQSAAALAAGISWAMGTGSPAIMLQANGAQPQQQQQQQQQRKSTPKLPPNRISSLALALQGRHGRGICMLARASGHLGTPAHTALALCTASLSLPWQEFERTSVEMQTHCRGPAKVTLSPPVVHQVQGPPR